MKPPAVPAAAARLRTREGNRGDSDDGQQFTAEGLPPCGAISPIWLCRRWDKHAGCRQTDPHTHTYMKSDRQKERERNSHRDRKKGLTVQNVEQVNPEFYLSATVSCELVSVQPSSCQKGRIFLNYALGGCSLEFKGYPSPPKSQLQ